MVDRAFVLAHFDQLVEGERPVVFQDQAGAHLLAEVRIGDRHARHVLHRRMGEDQVLHFLAAYLLAAAAGMIFNVRVSVPRMTTISYSTSGFISPRAAV